MTHQDYETLKTFFTRVTILKKAIDKSSSSDNEEYMKLCEKFDQIDIIHDLVLKGIRLNAVTSLEERVNKIQELVFEATNRNVTVTKNIVLQIIEKAIL